MSLPETTVRSPAGSSRRNPSASELLRLICDPLRQFGVAGVDVTYSEYGEEVRFSPEAVSVPAAYRGLLTAWGAAALPAEWEVDGESHGHVSIDVERARAVIQREPGPETT